MKNCNKWLGLIMGLALAGAVPAVVRAGVKTWLPTSGTNVWAVDGNWSGGTMPVAGDDVVITNRNVGVVVSAVAPASGWLNSLTISNTATLIFSNWTTSLSASNVTIQTNARMTCAGPFTTNAPDTSNRVWLVCSNLTIDAGGGINTDGKGYRGGVINANGYGPGAGLVIPNSGASGAGYGGQGGKMGGRSYGAAESPSDPGSGGGGGDYSTATGGAGGGLVRIEASGIVTLNGSITANGLNGAYEWGGGGSGGGVYLQCDSLVGNSGTITANGGTGEYWSGGGSGGRIAVLYNPNSQTTVPGVTFSVKEAGSANSSFNFRGDMGTLYFPDKRFLAETLPHTGVWTLPPFASWSPNSLTVSNGCIRFAAEGFRLTVTNNLTILGSSGRLELGGNATTNLLYGVTFPYSDMTTGPVLNVGGNLILTNSGSLLVCAGQTNAAMPTYGALVSVSNDVFIGTNCWVIPASHPVNGRSVCFTMSNLTVAAATGQANAGFNADGRGYRGGPAGQAGSGPGGGRVQSSGPSGGGGYGGFGGWLGGKPYGNPAAPTEPGSGGGGRDWYAGLGGCGGGLVWLQAQGVVTLNGLISANGQNGESEYVGGGSGGGVYIVCDRLAGQYGMITVNGGKGDGTAGSGGGGRIAVLYNPSSQTAVSGITFSASPAFAPRDLSPTNGDIGTLYFPDGKFLTETILHSGQWANPSFTSWAPNSLTVSNTWIRFPVSGFSLNVTNNVNIWGTSGRLDLGGNACTNLSAFWFNPYSDMSTGPSLTVGRDLVVNNGGRLQVFSAATNAGGLNYGALVSVSGSMLMSSNAWVCPMSHPTNGGSAWFRVGALTVADTNSGVSADLGGFLGGPQGIKGFGPQAGGASGSSGCGGGGYGGRGGGTYFPGNTYGSSNAPLDAGSGGGGAEWFGGRGGCGGGAVRVEARGTVTLNGILSANGGNAEYRGAGGGAGGSVYIVCRRFNGSATGTLRAKGGNGDPLAGYTSGGGGGGRIAIWRVSDGSSGTVSTNVSGGTSYLGSPPTNGAPGTVVWGLLPAPGTAVFLR